MEVASSAAVRVIWAHQLLSVQRDWNLHTTHIVRKMIYILVVGRHSSCLLPLLLMEDREEPAPSGWKVPISFCDVEVIAMSVVLSRQARLL
jgi:hypothetical protein